MTKIAFIVLAVTVLVLAIAYVLYRNVKKQREVLITKIENEKKENWKKYYGIGDDN